MRRRSKSGPDGEAIISLKYYLYYVLALITAILTERQTIQMEAQLRSRPLFEVAVESIEMSVSKCN